MSTLLAESDKQGFVAHFNAMKGACYENSASHGFWKDGRTRNRPEMLMLMVSELSECLEALRQKKQPHMSDHITSFTMEEEELADCMIRIMDYAGGFDLRVAEALIAKMEYNANRPHMHGKTL